LSDLSSLKETKHSDVSRKIDKSQEFSSTLSKKGGALDDIPDETYTSKYKNKPITHNDLLDREISIYDLKEQKNSIPNMASPQDSYIGNSNNNKHKSSNSMVIIGGKKEVRDVNKEYKLL
jgi:hypothetical protein